MIENETTLRNQHLHAVAMQMMGAARTAPKACGVDNLEIALISGDDIFRLAAEMARLAGGGEKPAFFERDAANIESSGAVVLIGTRNAVLKLNCGWCGWSACADKPAAAPCAFNMNDLGLAVGSAVSVAADARVDTRVMFSAGVVAQRLEMVQECHAVLAIPLSISGKSPYFDRKPKEVCNR